MDKKNEKIKSFLLHFITFSFLFSIFISRHAYATGDTVVDGVLIEVTQVLLVIAGLLCLGKLIQIGIMYMTSSAVEKSQAKTALMPWLVGTIVAFGASWIGPLIVKIIAGGFENRGPLDY